MESKRVVIVEGDVERLVQVVGVMIESMICEAVNRQNVFRVALAGGTTPRALYQYLAGQAVRSNVPYQRVEFFFGDERDVPHDNIESNYRMVQRTLLDSLPVEPGNIYPMPADRDDLGGGAVEYEKTIRNVVPAGPDGIPVFDLVLLGIGGDGHTASLFPGTAALDEQEKLVIAHFVPVLGRNRMTFTFPLINAARYVICLVTGEDKAQVMADILGEGGETKTRLPAARVNPQGTLMFAMDAAAARERKPQQISEK
jgi:6-phosphogluconolactonase